MHQFCSQGIKATPQFRNIVGICVLRFSQTIHKVFIACRCLMEAQKGLQIKFNVELTLCILDCLYCIVYLALHTLHFTIDTLCILQIWYFVQISRDSLHAPYPYHFPPTIILQSATNCARCFPSWPTQSLLFLIDIFPAFLLTRAISFFLKMTKLCTFPQGLSHCLSTSKLHNTLILSNDHNHINHAEYLGKSYW